MTVMVRKEMPALFWAIVALAVLLPLPLGAVYRWSWAAMASVVGTVLAIWSVRVAAGRQEAAVGLRSVWPLTALFGTVVVWVLLQSQPFTPADWHHPLWQTAADTLGRGTMSAISLNPFETSSGLARLLAYAGLFWITLQYCRRAARARQVLSVFAYAGIVYAVYAIVVYLTGLQVIGILRRAPDTGGPMGTFLDRDSFAAYAGLGLLCCSALCLLKLTQAAGPAGTGKERALQFVHAAAERSGWLVLAWPVPAIALALSNSVAGSVAAVLALLSLTLAAAWARAVDRQLALAFGALCAAGLLYVCIAHGSDLRVRVTQSPLGVIAGAMDDDPTVTAIRDAGALGTGFGTFDEALRFYRTGDVQSRPTARNTDLENVVELGIPAALALFAVFAVLLALCAAGIRQRRRDAIYPCVGFAATILIAVQSAIDVGVEVPAIIATYMVIMGAACAQSWSSRRPVDPW
jgi:hypothetical protein